MAGVFQNTKTLTPPPPSPPGECVRGCLCCGGEDTLARRIGGWGVNILENVRHSSVLYVCKYFVIASLFDSGNKHKIVNISENFHANFKWPQWDTQGPVGIDS
jgi:hypothetical protein